jgi:ribose 5-phosphate isomerase B
MIRRHNDANILALGVHVVGQGLALDIVDAFLAAEFEGGRHAARVAMIESDQPS